MSVPPNKADFLTASKWKIKAAATTTTFELSRRKESVAQQDHVESKYGEGGSSSDVQKRATDAFEQKTPLEQQEVVRDAVTNLLLEHYDEQEATNLANEILDQQSIDSRCAYAELAANVQNRRLPEQVLKRIREPANQLENHGRPIQIEVGRNLLR
jgi:hypothetical protein